MNTPNIGILQMFNYNNIEKHVPIEDILAKFPNGMQDLQVLMEAGLLRPYNDDNYDSAKDLMDQVNPGPRLTQAGSQLLFRSQFMF